MRVQTTYTGQITYYGTSFHHSTLCHKHTHERTVTGQKITWQELELNSCCMCFIKGGQGQLGEQVCLTFQRVFLTVVCTPSTSTKVLLLSVLLNITKFLTITFRSTQSKMSPQDCETQRFRKLLQPAILWPSALSSLLPPSSLLPLPSQLCSTDRVFVF